MKVFILRHNFSCHKAHDIYSDDVIMMTDDCGKRDVCSTKRYETRGSNK